MQFYAIISQYLVWYWCTFPTLFEGPELFGGGGVYKSEVDMIYLYIYNIDLVARTPLSTACWKTLRAVQKAVVEGLAMLVPTHFRHHASQPHPDLNRLPTAVKVSVGLPAPPHSFHSRHDEGCWTEAFLPCKEGTFTKQEARSALALKHCG